MQRQDFGRRGLHPGKPAGERLHKWLAIFFAFAMDEELFELIEEQHDGRRFLPRGCVEQG